MCWQPPLLNMHSSVSERERGKRQRSALCSHQCTVQTDRQTDTSSGWHHPRLLCGAGVLSPLGKCISAAALPMSAVCPSSHRAPKKCWPTQPNPAQLMVTAEANPHQDPSSQGNIPCPSVQLHSTALAHPAQLCLAQWDPLVPFGPLGSKPIQATKGVFPERSTP